MKIKLNGWQRLGVVVSLLWFIFVGSYAAYEYLNWPEVTGLLVGFPPVTVITAQKDATVDLSSIVINQSDLVPDKPGLRLNRFVLTLFLPVFCFWSISYLLIWTIKWVRSGSMNSAKTT
jgi:hypothetical protein